MSDTTQPLPPHSAPPRAVVRDAGGKVIELLAYDATGRTIAVPISAHRAIDLAADLIEAARRRL